MKNVKIIGWLFAVFLIIPTLSQGQSKIEFLKHNRGKIHFQLINNLIVIPVNLNGTDLNLLLDTGSDKTIFFNLDQYNIELEETKNVNFTGIGGGPAIRGLQSSGNTLLIADVLKFSRKTYYVILDNIPDISGFMGMPIHGIIGYEIFKNYPVYINYDREILYIYENVKKFDRKTRRAVEFDFALENNKPLIRTELEINGEPEDAKFLIDIGNSNSFYFYEEFAQGKYSSNYMETYLGRGVGGDIYGIRSRMRNIRFADFNFDYPIIAVPYNVFYARSGIHHNRSGSIGGGIFRRFKVYIDYPRRKLYLKKGKEYDHPFHINMSGLQIIYRGRELKLDSTLSRKAKSNKKAKDPYASRKLSPFPIIWGKDGDRGIPRTKGKMTLHAHK